jgi:glycosyltransferase involved in cell wall biosynthesis
VSRAGCDDHPRPSVLIIGPVPPPAFGVAQATALMLESPVLAERLRIVHLDTSDRRSVANIGRFDLRNVQLAFAHSGRLRMVLAREKPDVTLLTASQGTLGLMRDALLVAVGHSFKSRIVTYLRGSQYADIRAIRGRPAEWMLRSIVKHSALVVVLGESLVDMARAVCPKTRVAVIPNGSPRAVPSDQVCIRDQDHPIVAYIGRLAQEKGIDEAIECAKLVANAIPTVEFLLHGDWESLEYEAHVKGLIEQYGLGEVIRFPGPVDRDEKAALLARAWVLIVPSHSEGHPWVILEAMSAGVPVVATDTGAIAETITDGVAGFVVPIGDAASFAERVSALLRDDDLWKLVSQGGLRRYEEHFTMEQSHHRLAAELCRVAEESCR